MAYPDEIVLIRSTYATFGGVERVALSLIRGLLEKGVRVRVLSLPGQEWPVADPNLKIVGLGIARGHRVIRAWAFNRAVNRHLQRHPCDCVLALDKVTHFTHLHAGGGTHRSFLAVKKRYAGLPARILLNFNLFHRYMIHIERKGFANPHLKKIRCNSRMVMDIIQRDYGVPPEKLVLVHSGIRWKEMQATFSRRDAVGRELCRENGLDKNWKSLLFLGSNFLHKGLDIAIKGLAAMSPEFHLVVVGKGNPKPFLRQAATLGLSGRIHFLGPRPQGWRYATFCRAVVLPSRYDPFGGASAEGHAMGLPVLVSDRTGYADWVLPAVNGVILKAPMDDRRIVEAFRSLEALIRLPEWSPEQIREHARNVDDDVILDQLMEKFF